MAELSYRKRVRSDPTESDPESKRIREDLLSLLDDSDIVPDRDSACQDLDSVIRSFEEEITGSGTRPGSPEQESIVDLTSDSGESLPELGQLLGFDFGPPVTDGEASDLLPVSSEPSGIGEFWDFQDEFQGYQDEFGFGLSYVDNNSNSGQGENAEYVALDGIFDYSDDFGSDINWRPETLPAM